VSKKPRILFMGTPEFAVPALRAVMQYEIAGVVTAPDKPKGRGLKLMSSPVKQWAEEHGLKIFQPTSLKDSKILNEFRDLCPDYIVVASYGKILPAEMLKIPAKMPLNVHPSLLPRYRGAAPVPWTLINGEEETGVTIFEMDEGMDTGRIILQKRTGIKKHENAGELLSRLSELGAEALVEAIEMIEKGEAKPVPQNHQDATYAPMLKKTDGLIRWEKTAVQLHNHVRGMNPWPGAYTFLKGKLLKLWVTDFISENTSEKPGTVVKIAEGAIFVQTGDGTLIIRELQLEGKKRMTTKDFLSGHKIEKGILFQETGK